MRQAPRRAPRAGPSRKPSRADATADPTSDAVAFIVATFTESTRLICPAPTASVRSADVNTIELRKTPDILAGVGAWRHAKASDRPVVVGIAAETAEALARGRRKLASKRSDFIVVNDVLEPGAGFEVETNVVTLVGPDWEEPLPLQAKSSVAGAILDRVERLLGGRAAEPGR